MRNFARVNVHVLCSVSVAFLTPIISYKYFNRKRQHGLFLILSQGGEVGSKFGA